MLIIESRLYAYPRCRKNVKFTSGLTRHIIAYQISITLPSCQPFTLVPILKYNTTNYSDLLTDNFGEDISLRVSKNGKQRIRSADINNNKKDIRPTDINK